MDGTRLAAGTVVGGVTLFVLGYLIFDVALGDFYVANSGSATGLWRNAPLWWAAILGTLAYGALITFAIGNASGASSPAACATSAPLSSSSSGSPQISSSTATWICRR
jgi:hypothetical protein